MRNWCIAAGAILATSGAMMPAWATITGRAEVSTYLQDLAPAGGAIAAAESELKALPSTATPAQVAKVMAPVRAAVRALQGELAPGPTANQMTATTVSGPIVPNVTGQELDHAEATLRAGGLHYKVFGGGVFGVVVASDWTVCSQKPSGGTKASSVNLVVARSCSS